MNLYFLNTSKILEIREIEASIIISNITGFDVNETILNFGKVMRGGSSTKQISIENNFNFPIEVSIYGEGEIKKFIFGFKEKIEVGKKKNIKIVASVPDDAEFGEYKGKIIVKIKKDI